MITQIITRNSTAQEWKTANPILKLGEQGYDTTNKKIKVGDGVTAWNNLEFITSDSSGGLTPEQATLLGTASDLQTESKTLPGAVNELKAENDRLGQEIGVINLGYNLGLDGTPTIIKHLEKYYVLDQSWLSIYNDTFNILRQVAITSHNQSNGVKAGHKMIAIGNKIYAVRFNTTNFSLVSCELDGNNLTSIQDIESKSGSVVAIFKTSSTTAIILGGAACYNIDCITDAISPVELGFEYSFVSQDPTSGNLFFTIGAEIIEKTKDLTTVNTYATGTGYEAFWDGDKMTANFRGNTYRLSEMIKISIGDTVSFSNLTSNAGMINLKGVSYRKGVIFAVDSYAVDFSQNCEYFFSDYGWMIDPKNPKKAMLKKLPSSYKSMP